MHRFEGKNVMESNELTAAVDLFRRRLGREPTETEVARIEEGIRRGRDVRRVIAGFMAMDYHRARRGPDAMSWIRSHRRPGPRGASSSTELREKVHAAVDALLDYLEAARDDRSRDERFRGRGSRGRGRPVD